MKKALVILSVLLAVFALLIQGCIVVPRGHRWHHHHDVVIEAR